ncbi:MAG: hypothetical protein QOD66_1539 [Solirubrobacteraceae bacterium]|nr:hypothetical protein [Solirubrobacteraceae bacterium]
MSRCAASSHRARQLIPTCSRSWSQDAKGHLPARMILSASQPAGERIAIIWCVLSRLGRSATALAAVLAVLALGGCGSSTPSPKLSSSEAVGLRQGLASIVTAASAHNRQRAQAALAGFAHLVAADAAAGDVSSQDLHALQRSIAQVRQRIALEVSAPTPPAVTPPVSTPPTATTSSTPQTPPGPVAPNQKHGPEGKGHDHSKKGGD